MFQGGMSLARLKSTASPAGPPWRAGHARAAQGAAAGEGSRAPMGRGEATARGAPTCMAGVKRSVKLPSGQGARRRAAEKVSSS